MQLSTSMITAKDYNDDLISFKFVNFVIWTVNLTYCSE